MSKIKLERPPPNPAREGGVEVRGRATQLRMVGSMAVLVNNQTREDGVDVRCRAIQLGRLPSNQAREDEVDVRGRAIQLGRVGRR